jgi:hypothetical protein
MHETERRKRLSPKVSIEERSLSRAISHGAPSAGCRIALRPAPGGLCEVCHLVQLSALATHII